MPGSWEFPGGKVEAGESRQSGLERELNEELGVSVTLARPLIRYEHRYDGCIVDLDVWMVEKWIGTPQGLDRQSLAWLRLEELDQIDLLPADYAVKAALKLPASIAITPPDAPVESLLDQLEHCQSKIVCVRLPRLGLTGLLELASKAACRLEGTGTRLVINGSPSALLPEILCPSGALKSRVGNIIAGVHVPSRYLLELRRRPTPPDVLFGASCHDQSELKLAVSLGADYAFLGPVRETTSHPGRPGLGWDRFSELVSAMPLPVYAIGGLAPSDTETAWNSGAQGVAGIRDFWALDC
jgi:8-oxo-dGTP diphosphatase